MRLTTHVGEEGETAEQLNERVENTEVIATAQDRAGCWDTRGGKSMNKERKKEKGGGRTDQFWLD